MFHLRSAIGDFQLCRCRRHVVHDSAVALVDVCRRDWDQRRSVGDPTNLCGVVAAVLESRRSVEWLPVDQPGVGEVFADRGFQRQRRRSRVGVVMYHGLDESAVEVREPVDAEPRTLPDR